MKRTQSFVLMMMLLLCVKLRGQNTENTNSIFLEVLTDSLELHNIRDTSKIVNVKFSNKSNVDFLTYGLGQNRWLRTFPYNSSNACKLENVSSGFGMILYDIDGEEVFASLEIKDSFNHKPVTKQDVDSVVRKAGNRFMRDTLVLKKFSSRNFERKIDLHDYGIEKGVYFIRVIFYCGQKITFYINEGKITSDCKSLHAKLYQGCSLSNKIKLIVK